MLCSPMILLIVIDVTFIALLLIFLLSIGFEFALGSFASKYELYMEYRALFYIKKRVLPFFINI